MGIDTVVFLNQRTTTLGKIVQILASSNGNVYFVEWYLNGNTTPHYGDEITPNSERAWHDLNYERMSA